MSEKEDTISKTETIDTAISEQIVFDYNHNQIIHGEEYINGAKFGAQWQLKQSDRLRFENEVLYLKIYELERQSQRSYSEQEVLIILETFKARIINSARVECWDFDNYKVDKDSISDIDYTDLLKPKV